MAEKVSLQDMFPNLLDGIDVPEPKDRDGFTVRVALEINRLRAIITDHERTIRHLQQRLGDIEYSGGPRVCGCEQYRVEAIQHERTIKDLTSRLRDAEAERDEALQWLKTYRAQHDIKTRKALGNYYSGKLCACSTCKAVRVLLAGGGG